MNLVRALAPAFSSKLVILFLRTKRYVGSYPSPKTNPPRKNGHQRVGILCFCINEIFQRFSSPFIVAGYAFRAPRHDSGYDFPQSFFYTAGAGNCATPYVNHKNLRIFAASSADIGISLTYSAGKC